MKDDAAITNSRSLSVITFVVGMWLIVSAYVLADVSAQARWEQTIAGLVVAVLAAVQYYAPVARWASWTSAAVALWLIVAPFVSGYDLAVAFWNEIVTGVVVGTLALWNAGLNDTGLYTHHGHAI